MAWFRPESFILPLILLLMTAFTISGQAEAGSITANVDQLNFENGEEIALTVEVEGSLDQELSFPDSPDFKVSGTSKSTQVQIINGSYSKKNVYQFSLFPTKTGKLNIPAIEAKIDGVVQKTIPIPITVGVPSSGSGANNGNGGSNSGSNSGGPSSSQSNPNGMSDSGDSQMFVVERQVSPGPYYVHKPVVETIKVLRRVDWQAASKTVDSSTNWQVYDVAGEQQSVENRRGINYRVLTLKRVLVPLKAGTLSAPGWTLNVEFIDLNKRRSVSPFDFFSQAPLSKRLIAAPEVSLPVGPVPEADLPVGVLDPKVQLSQSSVGVGESVTVTFSVSGEGWFSGMGLNPPELSGDFKTYQDQPSTKEDVTGSGISGEKSLKVSIIPHGPGEILLPDWKFRYFDTKTGKITEKIVSIPEIQVSGQKEDLVMSGGGVSSPKKTKGSDFQPPDFHYGSSFGMAYGKSDRWVVLGLNIVSGIGFLATLIFSLRRRWLKGKNPEYLHSMQAWQKFRGNVSRARKEEELLLVFREYSASRNGSQTSAMTHRDVTSILAKDGWQKDLLDQITQVFVAVDAKRYGEKHLEVVLPLEAIRKEVKRKKPCLN